jgi:hypothetical protein
MRLKNISCPTWWNAEHRIAKRQLRMHSRGSVFDGNERTLTMARRSWIDPETNDPLIDDYAKQLESFMRAFQDGVISDKEISDQEARLVDLMKEVESKLDDETHAQVTRLLCELTAYDIMQFTYEMQQSRAKMFRG